MNSNEEYEFYANEEPRTYFNNKIENICKTVNMALLILKPRKSEIADHSIIIACIVACNSQDLEILTSYIIQLEKDI